MRKTTKKKTTKNKSKRGRGRRRPWVKFLIIMGVIIVGVTYGIRRHGRVEFFKNAWKGYPPKRKTEVNLYFGDPYSDYLRTERRRIPTPLSQEQKITEIVKELIEGPRGELIRTIPPRTILKNVRIDRDGVVVLNFNSQLSKNHPGGSSAELLTVYSIVNSVLLNSQNTKRVRILIEGNSLETLAGHIDCSVPFATNRDFIK